MTPGGLWYKRGPAGGSARQQQESLPGNGQSPRLQATPDSGGPAADQAGAAKPAHPRFSQYSSPGR